MSLYYCHPNTAKDKKRSWPVAFVFPPRVGDRVESLDKKQTLTIVRVTHHQDGEGSWVTLDLHK